MQFVSTGNKVEDKWHYQKAAQNFNQLSQWLDHVWKGEITADDADVKVAKAEAADLWDALNTADRVGNVVAEIKAKDAAGDHNFRTTIKRATGRSAVAYLTGVEFDYDERGKPTQKGPPKFVARSFIALDLLSFRSEAQGLGDALFDLFDVTGVGEPFGQTARRGMAIRSSMLFNGTTRYGD